MQALNQLCLPTNFPYFDSAPNYKGEEKQVSSYSWNEVDNTLIVFFTNRNHQIKQQINILSSAQHFQNTER